MPGPTIDQLAAGYARGASRPTDVVERVLARIDERGDDGTWITTVRPDDLRRRAKELELRGDPERLPLYGIPFGVKDSIDVAGLPTTLACPGYAYDATTTAPAVRRLLDAGAILVGKTNLDQFATGLNGTRTPYTRPHSVYGPRLICGGSSSGSALAVACGEVPFSVATDTAGSGRVPAALNGIVGYKPSRGLISTVGLVPACRSLDCVSLMGGTIGDVARVMDVVAAVDPLDPASRARRREAPDPGSVRIGLPDVGELEFFGDTGMRDAHLAARARLHHTSPHVVSVPYGPFHEAGELLYAGPWVAERLAEFGDFLAARPAAVLPVIRAILRAGERFSAVDTFRAQHRLGELRGAVAALWERMDVLVLPALGTTFSPEQVLADPIRTNTMLGHYTHFGNLLDLCATVVPAGFTTDGRPAALMVLGPALADDRVLRVAATLVDQELPEVPHPLEGAPVTLVVVGHHMSGQDREPDMLACGARMLGADRTAPEYRLLLAGRPPGVPALVRVPSAGAAIEVELWSVPAAAVPSLLASAAPSVAIGRVTVADGSTHLGFVADPGLVAPGHLVSGQDITRYGGWRSYLADLDGHHAVPA